MDRIFLRHSARDLPRASAINGQLEARGLSVDLDAEHPAPGESLTQKLQQAIGEPDGRVALPTPRRAPRSDRHQEIGVPGTMQPALARVLPGVPQDARAAPPERASIRLNPPDPREGLARPGQVLPGTAGATRQTQLVAVLAGVMPVIWARKTDATRQTQLVAALALTALVLLLLGAPAQSASG